MTVSPSPFAFRWQRRFLNQQRGKNLDEPPHDAATSQGPILAPIALPLSIMVGAIAGHRIDKAQGGRMDDGLGVFVIAQDVIEIARAFFQLFIDTFTAIAADFIQKAER